MKYYASHYVWHAGQNKLFRMQRIGLEEPGGKCVCMDPLEEEVRHTQWLSGLIVLAPSQPLLEEGESFQTFCERMSHSVKVETPLYAFHVLNFHLQTMSFTAQSRLVRLL